MKRTEKKKQNNSNKTGLRNNRKKIRQQILTRHHTHNKLKHENIQTFTERRKR